MTSHRISYFDALKGFCIILVVFCHYVVLSKNTIIGNFIMSFAWAAVPCFFMVTGGLLHRTSVFSWKNYAYRILKIYLTLTIWKLLYLCFYMQIKKIQISALGIIKYLFFLGNLESVDLGPLWFMNAYLQVLIIYPITFYLKSNKKGTPFLVFLCFILWFSSIFSSVINSLGINIVSPLLNLIPLSGYTSMLYYFVLGILLYENSETISNFISKSIFRSIIPWGMLIIGIAGTVAIKYFETGSIRWNGIYLTNGYNRLSTMIMAIGLYLIFSLKYLGKLENVFCKLGKHTMGIYYLHYPFLALFRILCEKSIENFSQYYSLTLNILQTAITVLVCLCITAIAKKIPIIKNIFC